jgi:hypothetical protein
MRYYQAGSRHDRRTMKEAANRRLTGLLIEERLYAYLSHNPTESPWPPPSHFFAKKTGTVGSPCPAWLLWLRVVALQLPQEKRHIYNLPFLNAGAQTAEPDC